MESLEHLQQLIWKELHGELTPAQRLELEALRSDTNLDKANCSVLEAECSVLEANCSVSKEVDALLRMPPESFSDEALIDQIEAMYLAEQGQLSDLDSPVQAVRQGQEGQQEQQGQQGQEEQSDSSVIRFPKRSAGILASLAVAATLVLGVLLFVKPNASGPTQFSSTISVNTMEVLMHDQYRSEDASLTVQDAREDLTQDLNALKLEIIKAYEANVTDAVDAAGQESESLPTAQAWDLNLSLRALPKTLTLLVKGTVKGTVKTNRSSPFEASYDFDPNPIARDVLAKEIADALWKDIQP